MATQKTPKQLADEQRRDVLAYAYRDTDGKLYALNASGDLVPAAAGAKALPADSQKDAEQFAAILMMRSKVLALNPEDQSIFTQIMNGQRKVDETLTSGVREAVDAFKKTTGLSLEIPGAATARAVGSGLSVLPSFISETWDAAGNILSQLGGGQISREAAIAAGAAYGSARQVAKDERPSFTDGLLSKNFFSFAFAGLKYLVDLAMGFAEKLPMVGDFIKEKGWHSGKSLAQFVEEGSREADNERVAHEMTKLKKIGGLDSTELAGLATRGGVVRTHDGRQVTVAAADASASAPHAQGATLPTGVDAAAAERKANGKGLLDRLKMAAGEADFSATQTNIDKAGIGGTALLGGVSALAAYHTLKGAAEGAARTVAHRPNVLMERAIGQNNEYARQAAQLREGRSAWRFWENDAAREVRAARLDQKAADAAKDALKHLEVVEGRAAFNSSSFMQRAVTPISELHDSRFARGLAYVTQGLGRLTGDMTGKLTNAVTGTAQWGAAKVTGALSDAAQGVQGLSKLSPFARRLGTAGAVIGPGMDVADIIDGTQKGNAAQVANAKGSLISSAGDALIGVGVAAGATLLAGGAVLSAPVLLGGAAVGALAGGVVSFFTGGAFERVPDNGTTSATTPKADGALGATHKGLAELAIQQTDAARVAAAQSDALERLRMATAVGRTGDNRKVGLLNFNLGITNSDVKLGSTVTALATPTGGSTANTRAGETPVSFG